MAQWHNGVRRQASKREDSKKPEVSGKQYEESDKFNFGSDKTSRIVNHPAPCNMQHFPGAIQFLST
jgi:hypothetical protein